MASQYDLQEEQELDQDDDIELDNDDTTSGADDSKSQPQEDFNIAARQRVREELSQQIEAFLARGGRINEVPNQVTSHRPGKPASEYTGSLM